MGKDYLACSAARGRGTCTNTASIRRQELEELILDALRQQLMAPKLVEEFVGAFHEEVNRQRRDAGAGRAGKERELAEVTRRLEGLVDALVEGYRVPDLQQRLDELEARRSALAQDLAAAPAPSPVRLHPNLARVYRRKVERLHEALGLLRGLIERVVLHPAAEDGQGQQEIELVGAVVRMIELGRNAEQAALVAEAACSVKLVAGAGCHLYRTWMSRCISKRNRCPGTAHEGPPHLRAAHCKTMPRRSDLPGPDPGRELTGPRAASPPAYSSSRHRFAGGGLQGGGGWTRTLGRVWARRSAPTTLAQAGPHPSAEGGCRRAASRRPC
ncbi:MAG: hypothetical protein ACJ8H8_19950 [Geminicoccaceae bacterium]